MRTYPWPLPPAVFFDWLARTSWQAAILVCLVLTAQTIFRKQLSPRWRCHLWLIVLVKLALPLPPRSSLSVFNLLPPSAASQPAFVVQRGSAPGARADFTAAPDTVNARRHSSGFPR